MPAPLAYFLTWTCYGQRLHGDERGSVDRDHNQPGTPYLPPDPLREKAERARMKGDIVFLSTEMRACAHHAVEQLCLDKRWKLSACNARPTHVHAIITCPLPPDQALAQVKARMTRDLRDAGLATPDARLWTRGGSKRWINHYPGLFGAIAYVNDWQTGPNREMLEEHKRQTRERIESLKAWLKSQGLPEDGMTVVAGESLEERSRRIAPNRSDEPRTTE
jgi:hypothetical protein